MAANSVDHKAVSEYLNNNRTKYQEVLDALVDFLHQAAERPPAKGRIYRIYTRADKQTGNIFKDVWKIVQKVNKEREKNAAFPISQIHDIIGLTAVVTYPSDIDIIRSVIDAQIKTNIYKSHADTVRPDGSVEYGESKQQRGYYAHHYQLELTDPTLRLVRCELQIKTVLHDAWGAKTHDLTYKPAGALDDRMQEQIQVLGDSLAAIDRQSELLKQIIERRWALDARKAKYAQFTLVRSTDEPEDTARRDEYLSIRDEIVKDETGLAAQPLASAKIVAIIDKLDNYAANGYGRDICRLFCLLAVIVGTEEMAGVVLDRVNHWLATAEIASERARALRFKAHTHFVFGDKIEAVNQAVSAVEVWDGDAPQRAALPADALQAAQNMELELKSSLAYYFADIAGSDAGQKMKAAEQAARYLGEAKKVIEAMDLASGGKLPDAARRLTVKDTEGAIKIAFGKKAEMVREGLRDCTAACDAMPAPGKDVMKLFLALHEIRAFQRILDLEQAP